GILELKSQAGDYDMRLVKYLRVYHLFGNDLTNDARNHMVYMLFTTKGGADQRQDYFHVTGLPTPIPETENHIWMTESSRYLVNNILFDKTGDPKFDNDKNGMTDWVLEGLRGFLVDDFYEFNSRPYAPLIYGAIQNLADFSGIVGGGSLQCHQVVTS